MKLLKIPSRPDSRFLVLTIYSVCVCCVPGFLKKNNNKKLKKQTFLVSPCVAGELPAKSWPALISTLLFGPSSELGSYKTPLASLNSLHKWELRLLYRCKDIQQEEKEGGGGGDDHKIKFKKIKKL